MKNNVPALSAMIFIALITASDHRLVDMMTRLIYEQTDALHSPTMQCGFVGKDVPLVNFR